MKSDLLNNYDQIDIVGDLNHPSVRWDGEWSNNRDNEFVECVRDVFVECVRDVFVECVRDVFVECVRDVFLTQTVENKNKQNNNNKTLGREKDIAWPRTGKQGEHGIWY